MAAVADPDSIEHLTAHRSFFEAIHTASPMSEVGIRGLFLVAECEELHKRIRELRSGAGATLDEIKRTAVLSAIERCGNICAASKALGVDRSTLYLMVDNWGIPRPRRPRRSMQGSKQPEASVG